MLSSLARSQLKHAVNRCNGLNKTSLPLILTTQAPCALKPPRRAHVFQSLQWPQQQRHFSLTTSRYRSTGSNLSEGRASNKNHKDNTSTSKTKTFYNSRILDFLTRVLSSRAPKICLTLFRLLKICFTLFVIGHFVTYIVVVKGTWGPSMIPTFSWSAEAAIISVYFHRRGRNVAVGDLISFENPVRPGYRSIKRVIGMPGDIVCRDTPGKGEGWLVQVPEGHCWVTGDNLDASRDSRMLGPIPLALVRGKVIAKLSPWPHFFKNGLVDAEDVEEWPGKEEEEEETGLVAAIKNQIVRSA